MEDYGFSQGLLSRLRKKILPNIPNENTFEFLLASDNLSSQQALAQINFASIADSYVSEELDLAIKALGLKVIAFGLDSNVKAHFDFLEVSVSPFELLFDQIQNLKDCNDLELTKLNDALESSETLTQFLRKNKNRIGTNLHLTVTTRRILEYIDRIKVLLNLKQNIHSKELWEKLISDHLDYSKQKYSIRRFVARHTDLVALEIVEHNANKGEKYIAESSSEYWSFFRKSILGGAIIAIFALIKIFIDSFSFSQFDNALLYSINYAVCFVLVKQFGGIIATKQPAVTASTLAKGIDKNDDLKLDSIQKITELIRRVSRSQFISIVGNFTMAILFAMIIAFVMRLLNLVSVTEVVNSEYLIKNTTPSLSLVFFASVAGCFLALSGLISGYIDNKILASRVSHRIRNGKRFFKSKSLAKFIEKKSGALIGNVCLGFFLGCAFLLSYLLPFSIDIRHIAFSSANIGYSIMENDQGSQIILFAICGALLIGFVNFIVSFTITILLALKSRNASIKILPKIFKSVIVDFFNNPLAYYFFKKQ